MDNIPYGYCQCGCGKQTTLAKRDRPYLGHVQGKALPFLRGHNSPQAKAKEAARRTQQAKQRHPQRFWQKVVKGESCWEWTGYKLHGYGRYSIGGRAGKEYGAHRVAYELVKGPIPEGLVLDHLCRNRSCVNPDHLQPVTHATNILRGEGASAQNAVKTHCKYGHEFNWLNTYITPSGYRKCRECARQYLAAWYRVNR